MSGHDECRSRIACLIISGTRTCSRGLEFLSTGARTHLGTANQDRGEEKPWTDLSNLEYPPS